MVEEKRSESMICYGNNMMIDEKDDGESTVLKMAETIKLNLNPAVFSILLLNRQVFFIKSIKLTKSIYFSQFFSLRSIFNAGTVIKKWQYIFLNRPSHMSAMTQNPVSVMPRILTKNTFQDQVNQQLL